MNFQKFVNSHPLMKDPLKEAQKGALALLEEDVKRGWWSISEETTAKYVFTFYTGVLFEDSHVKELLLPEIEEVFSEARELHLSPRKIIEPLGVQKVQLYFYSGASPKPTPAPIWTPEEARVRLGELGAHLMDYFEEDGKTLFRAIKRVYSPNLMKENIDIIKDWARKHDCVICNNGPQNGGAYVFDFYKSV